MPNELLLIISLAASYSLMLVAYKLFGKKGLYVWIPICTILANIEVTVMVNGFGLEQTLGNTLFASSYLATDILSERYGKKDASKAVWMGIFTSIVFIAFSFMWRFYTPSENDWAFPLVSGLFSNTPRILIASLLGYSVSEALDVKLYHFWWKVTVNRCGNKDRFLWLRNNGSTLISQFVNIVIFNFGAFLGAEGYTLGTVISITGACYLIYVFTSLLDTPFVYIARKMKIEDDVE